MTLAVLRIKTITDLVGLLFCCYWSLPKFLLRNNYCWNSDQEA